MDLLDLDTKQVPCEVVALGMENGLISDSQITATSVWNAVLSTRHGRLNDAASWSARKNDQDQWIQIDLGKKDVVAAIATQGRRNYNQWVKTYSVSYSSNGEHFDYYKINGLVREFNGNYDKNSLVENVLSPTVTTRYVRIHPKTWYGHISLRIEVYGCSSGPCKEGEVAFGMQNGKIHDSHITASSFWSASLSPQKARLNGVASWSSSGRNNQKQWIQIDLGKERVITAIATQGRANYNQWVKTYSVSYSLNGQNFQLYLINGVKKVFYGNSDRWSIVTNVLSQPITARYIRIHPESWYGHISMRLEIYGCYSYEGPCKSGEEALGVENGKISDITASSVWNAALSTQQGRLNSRSSWSARRNDQNQWIQVDLGRKETITVIATQGRSNYNQWVKTFSVFYSLNGHTFEPYKINGIQKVFTGNTDRNSVVFNVLSPTITTRYIRIHPKTWHYHISMRLELYGCKREKETLCNLGETTLGIEDGRIGSTQLISSTVWSPSYSAARGGRLYDAGAWIALANDLNQWMQVDLGRREVVTGIATQGRSNSNQWVKTYLVSYSLDGRIFNTYQSDGVDKTFIGNTDRNTIIKNVLSPAITARYVRIHPVTWQSHISMRMELYGCFRAPKPCDSTPCKNEGICQNDGESFLCTCVGSYEGKTCEEYASPCKTHEVGLGVEKGKIPDDQLTASTSYRVALNVLHGRLNGGPSWSARQNDRNQWMQVDLGREEVVTGIATQGRNNYNQWVKTYSVSYSLDGRIFYAYESGGVGKIFIGNTDRNTIIKNVLSPAITARYVRIHPVTWQRHISMRMELYGCYRAPKPCDSSPCKNEGKCTNEGNLSFSCKCRPYFIGLTCETELPNPCQAKPCRNGGHCVVLGNHYSCRCKPEFGGVHCEHSQSLCWAHGDPHYRSFDGLTFNFMGTCEYDFAKDCSVNKLFTVRTTNKRCGWGVSCTASVKIYIASYHILMTRVRQTAIVNGVKITRFPLFRPGFQITNPSVKLLIFSSTDIGLTVSWDTSMAIKVAVSGRFREKLCSSSLCGNNNGNKFDDNKFSRNCAPPADELSCIPDSLTQPIIDKCQLMNSPSSPFKHCNSFVDPTTLISDCKYDACRCKNPLQCVCAAFASYSKQCAAIQSVVEWRFKGTYLYEPLKECAQECKNPGEIFTECGSSCAKTCRDLSSDSRCSEECVPSCQCPEGQVLDDNSRCVPVTECTCFFQEKVYQPGQSIKIGNCKTCTCNAGGMACLDDKICSSKRPCESFPCKNGGV
ncbi:uncharacterized protein LOC114542082, partial [Dendronephthya gigantea]|uniref:uncharacterized protein LOC114542082 n=1 Tax=Dendronephthya gigantea TaxID=151771 RepID=UPI00106A883B